MKYDAFISYRHLPSDTFVAENLHKILESFSLPKNVVSPTGKTKITRVFRDRDELPLSNNLSDPIEEALKESEHLIVICSKALKESKWCMKEIDTFIELHGREKIFAVLIEGEPHQSFPPQILSANVKSIDINGNEVIIQKSVEPLAADVRGKNYREIKKRIKEESIRLLAPIFELAYDDLRQRHRERKLKRLAFFSTIAASIFLIFALTATLMALKIQSQAKIVRKNYATTLAESAIYSISKGRLNDALGMMEESEKQAETAKLALAKSMTTGKYCAAGSLVINHEYSSNGATHMLLSTDGHYLVCGNSFSTITVFDTKKAAQLEEFNITVADFYKDYALFLDDSRLVYNSPDGVHLLDISTARDSLLYPQISKIYYSLENGRLTLISNDTVAVFDCAPADAPIPGSVNNVNSNNNIDSNNNVDSNHNIDGIQNITLISENVAPGISGSTLSAFNEKNGYYCQSMPSEDGTSSVISVYDTLNGQTVFSAQLENTVVQLAVGYACIFYQDIPDTDANLYTAGCIEMESNKLLWEEKNESSRFTLACCDSDEAKKDLLVLTTAQDVRVVDMKTGDIINLCPLSYSPVNLEKKADSTQYLLPLTSGHVLSYDTRTFAVSSESFFANQPEIVATEVLLSASGNLYLNIVGNGSVTEYVKKEAGNSPDSMDIFTLKDQNGEYLLSSISSGNFGTYDYGTDDYSADDYSADDYSADDYSADDYSADDYSADDFETKDEMLYEIGIDTSKVFLQFFSSDKKYYIISLLSGGANVYSAADLSLVSSLPAEFGYIYGLSCIPGSKEYILDCQTKAYILNSDFEEIGMVQVP